MPRCHLLAVASGSALDRDRNDLSLFNLVDEVEVGGDPATGATRMLPLEVHAHLLLEPSELGRDIAIRCVLAGEGGAEISGGPHAVRSASRPVRVRLFGLPLPPSLGAWELRLDVRTEEGGPWVRTAAFWPLRFSRAALEPEGEPG